MNIPENLLDDVRVRLEFRVGESTISLQRLRSIQTGYVFELDQPSDASITVLAHGVAIGHGELVKVGDRLGIRIVELTGDGVKPA